MTSPSSTWSTGPTVTHFPACDSTSHRAASFHIANMDPIRNQSYDRGAYGDGEATAQRVPEMSLPNRSNTFPATHDGASNAAADGRPHQHRKQSSVDSPTTHHGNGSEELLGPAKNRPHKKKGTSRTCGKCSQPLLGQFVRALGDTYHLECFTCEVSPAIEWVPERIILTWPVAGLRQDSSVKVLPRARATSRTIPFV